MGIILTIISTFTFSQKSDYQFDCSDISKG
jgi:hypothetical protein